ncbi:MAG: hypothetical protein M5U14_12760 [Acidimicrobiia bacterium]|nr:hypothetical protein [Acidimicrobiia bacterium]
MLPGFALPPATARVLVRGAPDPLRADVTAAVARAWSDLSGDGRRALAVRSSSVVEDTGGSSMAGRFTSVLDVRGWNAFLDAVAKVVGSAALVESPDRAPDGRPEEAPMAVLVQPFVEADVGGVMFGVDPVTGDRDRVVVAAVPGSPARLVGGRSTVTISCSRGGGAWPGPIGRPPGSSARSCAAGSPCWPAGRPRRSERPRTSSGPSPAGSCSCCRAVP